MVYRIPALDVPADEPLRNDALERRPSVEFLIRLIARAGGPFVLALDSPWGTGKTTLVRMLEAELKRQDFCCITLNAWQVDYVTDPLVALVSSIDRHEFGAGSAAAGSPLRQRLRNEPVNEPGAAAICSGVPWATR